MKINITRQLLAATLAMSSVGCGGSKDTQNLVTGGNASSSGVTVRGWSPNSPGPNTPPTPLIDAQLTLLSRDAEAGIGDFTTGSISIHYSKISKDGKRAFFVANSRELSDEKEVYAFSLPPQSFYIYTTVLGSGDYDLITVNPAPGQKRFIGPQPLYATHFAISADGRYLAFRAEMPLDPAFPDLHDSIYRLDLESGSCELVSIAPDGTALDYRVHDQVSISGDGRFVGYRAFGETSDTDLYLRDMTAPQAELIATKVRFDHSGRTISADGNIVVFSRPAPAGEQGSRVYRHDRASGETLKISTNDWGEPEDFSITDNGRFIIYRSRAVGLSPEDPQRQELMVYDHQTGQTEQVNFDAQGNLIKLRQEWYIEDENPLLYDISEDGRWVLFVAYEPEENVQNRALYIKDRETNLVRRVSSPTHILNHPRPSSKRGVYLYYGMFATMTADGSQILYSDFIDKPGVKDLGSTLYLHENASNTEVSLTKLPSGDHMRAEAHSWQPSLSADGSKIAYRSSANLLGLPDAPHYPYARTYLLDVKAHTLRETSVDSEGRSAPLPNMFGIQGAQSKIAASGHRVVVASDFDSPRFDKYLSIFDVASEKGRRFGSSGDNNVDISANGEFLVHLGRGVDIRRIDSPPNDALVKSFPVYAEWVRISGDGAKVAFATSRDPANDSYLGAYVMFAAEVASGAVERLTQGDSNDLGEEFFGTYHPISRTMIGLSSDGFWTAFPSGSTNLVGTDTNDLDDLFLQDLQTKTVRRIQGPSEPDGPSYEPNLSADGRYTVFTSYASNLVDGDTNHLADVFVYDRTDGRIAMVSKTHDGGLGDGLSSEPAISDDGKYIAFSSEASNLIAEGTRRGIRQVYRVGNPLLATADQPPVLPRNAPFKPIAVRAPMAESNVTEVRARTAASHTPSKTSYSMSRRTRGSEKQK